MMASGAALNELVRSWASLPPDVRPLAAAVGRGRLLDAATPALGHASTRVRLGLAQMAGDARDAGLATIAGDLVADSSGDVAEVAERALVSLALAAAGESLGTEVLNPDGERIPADVRTCLDLGLAGPVDALAGAVANAARGYPVHHRRGVVLAALILLTPDLRARVRNGRGGDGERALVEIMTRAEHPAHAALRSMTRWSKSAFARLRAIEWLSLDAMAAPATDRLTRATSFAEHALVLERAHLLLRPARARRAGLVVVNLREGAMDLPVPRAGMIASLPTGARRMLPAFVFSIKSDAPARCEVLEPLLADPEPAVRHAAARRGPGQLIAELCLDQDVRVACSATLAWSTVGATGTTRWSHSSIDASRVMLCERLLRSGHAQVRAAAAQEIDSLPDPARDTIGGRLVLRRLASADREAVLEELRAQVRAGGEASVRAMQRLRRLGLTPFAQDVLIETIGRDSETRCVATATAALGEMRASSAAQAVASCVAHADQRVRANAVEAIGRLSRTPGVARLVDLKPLRDDPNHRVRANALRALLAGGEAAGDALGAMLADTRPMHRLAGVWVAQRTLAGSGRSRVGERWPELIARVGELAAGDPDIKVRRRARACGARLDADVRIAWKASVPWQNLARSTQEQST